MPKVENQEPVVEVEPQEVVEAPAAQPVENITAAKSNKKLFIILGVVAAVLILPAIIFFSLMAAGFAFFNAASDIKVTDMSNDGQTVTLTDDEGNETTYSGMDKLSTDYPKNDAPLLDDADVVSSVKSQTDGVTTWLVAVDSDNDFDSTAQKIKESYSQNGWTIDSEMISNDGGYYTASSEKYDAMITFAPSDNEGTEITHSIEQK